jgi:hypothetical protein
MAAISTVVRLVPQAQQEVSNLLSRSTDSTNGTRGTVATTDQININASADAAHALHVLK